MNERASIVSLCNLIKGFVEGEHGKIPYSVPVPRCSNPLFLLCVSLLSALISMFVQFHACYCMYCVDLDLCGPLRISTSNAFHTADRLILFHLYAQKKYCNFGNNSSCLHNRSVINEGTEQSGSSRDLAFSWTLPLCFPVDSALCSLAEPQTQERAPSGSNYCTTQPKWQMSKCHNTTACSLPFWSSSITHTH